MLSIAEELITQGEGIVNTEHEKILVLRGNARDLESLSEQINDLLDAVGTYDASVIRRKLREIVPEYMPQI